MGSILMPERCATCGTQTGTLRSFTQLEGPSQGHLTLCESCLDQRATKNWNANEAQGKELLEKVPTKDRYQEHRYAYLVEPEDTIHLVRLRHDWVTHHTEEP